MHFAHEEQLHDDDDDYDDGDVDSSMKMRVEAPGDEDDVVDDDDDDDEDQVTRLVVCVTCSCVLRTGQEIGCEERLQNGQFCVFEE